jgi:predicted RNase H-like HicB family nuclease
MQMAFNPMLTQYIRAALQQAEYTILEDETFYGSIPALQGVWANAETLSQCQQELQDTLEGWIVLGLHYQQPIPSINGIDITPAIAEVA